MVQQQSFKTACSYINTTSFFLSFFFSKQVVQEMINTDTKENKEQSQRKKHKARSPGKRRSCTFLLSSDTSTFLQSVPHRVLISCVCAAGHRWIESFWQAVCVPTKPHIFREESGKLLVIFVPTSTIFSEASGKLLAILCANYTDYF